MCVGGCINKVCGWRHVMRCGWVCDEVCGGEVCDEVCGGGGV